MKPVKKLDRKCDVLLAPLPHGRRGVSILIRPDSTGVGRIQRLVGDARAVTITKGDLMTAHTLKASGRTANRLPGREATGIEELDLSEFSGRVTQGATAKDANRIHAAQQEDDLIYTYTNRSLKDILKSLPTNDFDRETLEYDRGYLAKRCEQARTLMIFTKELSDVRKYVRLKAKVTVIDLILSSEVAALIEASLQHLES